jgi:hypothetical protein
LTIECLGTFDNQGNIRNISGKGSLDPLRRAHKAGDALRLIFSDEIESSHEKAFRLFHVYRDHYAAQQGLEPPYAKILLKYKYGVTIPYVPGFKPPVEWTRGQFVEIDGAIIYEKSTTIYTAEELNRLIEGTVSEVGA